MPEYLVTYDNDTGPNDYSFSEWWDVVTRTGEQVCKCDDEATAKHIADLLNANPIPSDKGQAS